jgi:hypothetical protein
MDSLLKQFAGAGGNLASLLSNNNQDSQENEELLGDEEIMENAKVYYDILIQNTLQATSHSVQWLPH